MKTIVAAAALALLGGAAMAQDADTTDRTGFGVNVGASTLGATVEPVWRITRNFGLRAPIGQSDFSFDGEYDGEQYEGDIHLGGYGLVGDYYPGGGGFHLSAGAFLTDYSADLTRSYDASGGMTTDLDVNVSQKQDIAPFLGMGYEGQIGKRLSLSLGAGALVGQGFDVSASESSGMVPQSEVDSEVSDFSETMNDLSVVPYVKFAIGLRF